MRISLSCLALAGIAAAILSAGCSSKAAETPKDAGTSADIAAEDAISDAASGATDAAAVPDTAAPQDAVVPPKDTAAPALACSDLFACASECPAVAPGADNPCAKACAAQGSTAAKIAFGDLGTCAVSLCGDVTETHARVGCMWTKCFDKLSACANFGSGSAGCASTAACFERCLPGDVACRHACVQGASEPGASDFAAFAACIEGKCGTAAEGETKAGCIASKCATEAVTCKGSGMDCLTEQACLAKCPVPLPNKPNTCKGMCAVLASTEGATASDAYATCQKQCAGSINIPDCIKVKCGAEQTTCFAGTGTQNCQAVYNCVKDKCEGIGGEEACINGCIADGTAPAKDAYVQYEGCILKLLDTQQAKRAGCTFPYDESTCLSQIKGLCSNQSNACFQPN